MWAIEDCRHVSGRLERLLVAAGERVVRVPPRLMAGARAAARERGKSDPIDALAVARAAIREGAGAAAGGAAGGRASWTSACCSIIVRPRRASAASAQQRLALAPARPLRRSGVPAGALDRAVWLDRVAGAGSPRRADSAGADRPRAELAGSARSPARSDELEREIGALVDELAPAAAWPSPAAAR